MFSDLQPVSSRVHLPERTLSNEGSGKGIAPSSGGMSLRQILEDGARYKMQG